MSRNPVRLHTWLRLQREGVAVSARADALCRALRGYPEVHQAYYLVWQAGAGIYTHEGSGQHLPPGLGDPLGASDARLFEQVAELGRLSLSAVRSVDCWLAGRLRRAGISHGQVFDLALEADQPGL
ncbi:PAS domain-containing sensor histidine kinase, partial [Pseudomonas otitidis]|nr:PAS domain-containing sensor histidine kinase [Pseudomonas otitidis]